METANIACRSVDLIYCDERKPYIILPSNLLYKIISNNDFNHLEKAYYLLADLYANLRRQKQELREIEKSAKEWAALLGCSEEWVFKMQKKLESLGFFYIIREKDEDNQNEKNIIIPTLPDALFYELAQEPNRIGKEHLSFSPTEHEGCKRSFLDDSKMFITFNLKMIKLLLSDHNLTALQKLIWIYFFSRSHRSYTDSYGDGTRNFITTYQEIAALFSCKENTVSTAIISLFQLGYISKRQFRIKGSEKIGRRKKKSCWEISALFPQNQMETLLKQPDRQNLSPLTLDDFRLYDLNKQVTKQQQTDSYLLDYHDRSAISHSTRQFNNKNNILNTKNIDQIETTNNQFDTTHDNNKSSNVFCQQNLIASSTEIAEGLQITEKFNANASKLAENTDYPKAIKQADLALTNQEHWLVTKTAYTLQLRLNDACELAGININHHDLATIKLKEAKFNQTEQTLIDMWHDFANMPLSKLEKEEFLLRRSWLLKLIPVQTTTNSYMPELSQVATEHNDLPVLPGDKEDKARKFAYALQERKLAKGYAAKIKPEELASEFIHHAATWHPERLHCKTREEQIDAALSFAWKAVEQGRWKCPYQWLNAQIAEREQVATLWKQW